MSLEDEIRLLFEASWATEVMAKEDIARLLKDRGAMVILWVKGDGDSPIAVIENGLTAKNQLALLQAAIRSVGKKRRVRTSLSADLPHPVKDGAVGVTLHGKSRGRERIPATDLRKALGTKIAVIAKNAKTRRAVSAQNAAVARTKRAAVRRDQAKRDRERAQRLERLGHSRRNIARLMSCSRKRVLTLLGRKKPAPL